MKKIDQVTLAFVEAMAKEEDKDIHHILREVLNAYYDKESTFEGVEVDAETLKKDRSIAREFNELMDDKTGYVVILHRGQPITVVSGGHKNSRLYDKILQELRKGTNDSGKALRIWVEKMKKTLPWEDVIRNVDLYVFGIKKGTYTRKQIEAAKVFLNLVFETQNPLKMNTHMRDYV